MSENNTCWTSDGQTPCQEEEKDNNNQELVANPTTRPPASTPIMDSKITTTKIRYNRIFKKVSSDGNLVLFLPQRELAVSEDRVESLMGVALIHENVMRAKNIKVFLQVLLIFRYGREDEELMGLRFCNEVVVASEQIYPSALEESLEKDQPSSSSTNSLQQRRNSTLVNNQGFLAVPFVVDMGSSAPPSIRLIPCRPYTGTPIGTSYEVQLFASSSIDELPRKRKMVQMSIRLYEKLPVEIPLSPSVVVQKDYVFSDNPLTISAKLDKAVYMQGDEIRVTIEIQRRDKQPHGVKKIKVSAFQQVSVAMFSTGSFKNNIGDSTEVPHPNPRNSEFEAVIPVTIRLAKDYAWAAMDDTNRKGAELTHLAPTVSHSNKCLFVVRVSYYLQVMLIFGLLKRPLGIKLPFILQRKSEDAATASAMTAVDIRQEAKTAAPSMSLKQSDV